MKKVKLNEQEYTLEKNYKDVFDYEEVLEKCTDYFVDFDYIFGDYSYNKLRMKGFYDSNNKNVKELNDIKHLDDYIKDYCAYNAGYFLLKKVKEKVE